MKNEDIEKIKMGCHNALNYWPIYSLLENYYAIIYLSNILFLCIMFYLV